MLLDRVVNNKDPGTIHRTVESVEEFFRTLRASSSGEVVNEETAEKLSPVAAAHRILTNSLAVMPWIIRQKEGDIRREVAHPLEYPLKIRANPYLSPYLAHKIIVSQAFWHGTGFGYIERENGVVTGIIPLPSAGWSLWKDPATDSVWYGFSIDEDLPNGKKLQRKFQSSELLIWQYETYDGVRGRGLLQLARETMGADRAAQKYAAKFYKNGAWISGLIETQEEASEDTRRIIQEDFERMYAGMDNAFRVAVMDLGMKYTPLGLSQSDSQYIETRAFSVDEISRFTGVPAYMLQTGKQSFQSNEQQQIDFVSNVLMGHIVQMEQEWTYKLFSAKDLKRGLYLKKNAAALMRGDSKSRSEFYQKMIGHGVYNQDDCRALEDLSPLPDGEGQHYWMSKNYAPIKEVLKGGKRSGA